MNTILKTMAVLLVAVTLLGVLSGCNSNPETCSHNWSDWTTTENAVCDEDGVQSRTCVRCDQVETKTIPATGHLWDSGTEKTVTATCGDMGVRTFHCENCSKTRTEQITGTHTFGQWEEITDDSSGSVQAFRTCIHCSYKEYRNTPNPDSK